jgi:hypothetical protein
MDKPQWNKLVLMVSHLFVYLSVRLNLTQITIQMIQTESGKFN